MAKLANINDATDNKVMPDLLCEMIPTAICLMMYSSHEAGLVQYG